MASGAFQVQQIPTLKFLHFNDNEKDIQENVLYKMQTIVDHLLFPLLPAREYFTEDLRELWGKDPQFYAVRV